jgi:hypothetical protein
LRQPEISRRSMICASRRQNQRMMPVDTSAFRRWDTNETSCATKIVGSLRLAAGSRSGMN